MSQQELLKKVIQTLDDAGIQYLVTGSVASSLQGEPRSTNDIDLVVAIERTDAKKYAEEMGGMRIIVSSPEDTILAKLRWAKLSGGSEKQFTDALRVYEVQFKSLNMDYLHSWAKKLGVESMLQKIQEEAEVI